MDDRRSVEYIATIDSSTPNPDGSLSEDATVLLDAIPVSSLDRMASTFREAPRIVGPDDIDHLLLQVPAGRLPSRLDEASGWFRIEVSADTPGENEGFEATAPTFGAAEEGDFLLRVNLSSNDIPRAALATLEEIGNLPDQPDATPHEIRNALHTDSLVAIAVYDIGQGSFSALVDGNEHPLVFFDFGWPLPFKAFSRPKTTAFDPFLPLRHPEAPVVLSHLDRDHWTYAIKSGSPSWDRARGCWRTHVAYRPDAIARPWIMQRPQVKRHALGPGHVHFALTLAQTKLANQRPALHIWPRRKSSINAGSITVFQCGRHSPPSSNPAYLRNNESLGMLAQHGLARALLCGDADYPSIPDAHKQHLTGMVAPHHGGATTAGTMPPAVGHGRMVLSTYGNAYPNVPHPSVLKEARQRGWSIARTDDRSDCLRCTMHHGHRMIRLAATPLCTCGHVDKAQLCISRP